MQFIKRMFDFFEFYLINRRIDRILKENKARSEDVYFAIGDYPHIPDEFYAMKEYKRREV